METIINERFFRKVDPRGTFKKSWHVFGIYFTISNCRVKKRITCGYQRNSHDVKKLLKIKQQLYEQAEGKCPHCGKEFDIKVMEMHHILPYSRFTDLGLDIRNLILLCHKCHKEIHCDPYLNIRLMEEKAQELGINLDERYNRGNFTPHRYLGFTDINTIDELKQALSYTA
jgi:CRISPR/Cas system Type II protein with McrA/HNH and RuvC-like nuclease domain